MAEFDLSALMKDVSRTNTGREQIQYIPFARIIPDKNNGYSMTGVDELARSIEIVGLQQPLRVRPIEESPGDYQIISGHRRHAAIKLLMDRDSQRFADGVPCIVDTGAASAALRELQLLLGNADNRKLSSADLEQQAERISDCLRRLEDEGYTFPGRHRDWVSKISGLSRSKLARLSAIKNNLLPELYKNYYRKGKLSETVAYALAKQDPVMQQQIVADYDKNGKSVESLFESDVTDYVDLTAKFSSKKCKVNKGGLCINQEGLRNKCLYGGWGYKPCRYGHCCADCDQYTNCKYRCPLMDDKAKAERAKKREESKDQKAAEKAAHETDIRNIEQVWARFGMALTAAGLTDKQLRTRLKAHESSYNEFENYMDKAKLAALLDYSCTETKPNDSFPFYYSFKADDYRRLCMIADTLGCSLDYLFCRSDTPNPVPAPEKPDISVRALGWLTGTAPDRVKCWAKFMDEATTEEFSAVATYDAVMDSWWHGDEIGKFSVVGAKCIGWWPLPEDSALDIPADLQPTDPTPRSWQSGQPLKPGLYAVRFKVGPNSPGEIHNFAKWDGFQWHAERSGKIIEDLIAAYWCPLPEEDSE